MSQREAMRKFAFALNALCLHARPPPRYTALASFRQFYKGVTKGRHSVENSFQFARGINSFSWERDLRFFSSLRGFRIHLRSLRE